MIPRLAQYLLRVDDLCPALARGRWRRWRELIREFGLRPILAVIPDNRDPSLESSQRDPGFWAEMREMEAAGATIGIHGYRHVCASQGKSLLRLHRASEFAGVSLETQHHWIRAGGETLRGQGLNPRLWIAPRHGFDRNTLRALREEGLAYISDGFARTPFVRGGITWIPQQLWAPVDKTKGLWTICIHPSSSRESDVSRLRSFLQTHASQFTCFDRVVEEFDGRRLGPGERIRQKIALGRFQLRALKRRWRTGEPD